jgi:hypothetical protein|nr:MAG TPA: hypothetical protein [Ackermannviridae sp.]
MKQLKRKMKNNMEEKIDTSNLSVIYVQKIGQDNDGNYVYEFLISEDPDSVWVENWNEVPVCNEADTRPSQDDYDYVKELRTDIKLTLGQDNCCVSFMDIKDNIAALAYEDISGYEEYPEPRLVIQYGDSLDYVEEMLAKRDLYMKYV